MKNSRPTPLKVIRFKLSKFTQLGGISQLRTFSHFRFQHIVSYITLIHIPDILQKRVERFSQVHAQQQTSVRAKLLKITAA